MFVITSFSCKRCNKAYDEKATAMDCCVGEVRVVNTCGNCRVEHKKHASALVCCTEYKVVDGDLIREKRHELKTWPEPFQAIRDGRKSFEIRKNDRDFKVGDLLVLREFDPEKGEYSGEKETVKVTYLLQGAFGLPDGLCVMSIE